MCVGTISNAQLRMREKMLCSKMAPSAVRSKEIQKEDVIQAVVILESFDDRFKLLTTTRPTALLPLVNCPIIEYILETLHSSGVHEVLLFCSFHVNKIKEYLSKTQWMAAGAKMKVTFVVSESCMSLGDVLRDIYDKRLVRDDFILLSGAVISNVQLKPILDEHKERRKKDKATVMTAVYKPAQPRRLILHAEPLNIVAYSAQTKRILHQQIDSSSRKTAIPLSVFQENSSVTICHNYLDCHVSMCSPEVLSLFADNFDYQTLGDFVKGILEHEEVLGNAIYLKLIEDEYAASVTNILSYRAISNDIINRWLFPIVPDLFTENGQKLYTRLRYNVYRHKDVTISRSCHLEEDVVIGSGSKVGDGTVVSSSVIGRNCKIGENVKITNAFIWDNVTIGDHCVVDTCILADRVVLKEQIKIVKSVLSYCVELEVDPGKCIENAMLASKSVDDADVVFSDAEDDLKDSVESVSDDGPEGNRDPWGLPWNVDVPYDSSDVESDDGEFADRASPHLDDSKLFFGEVLDTLARGVDENLKCENLVLEINALKYAYNVTMAEVNFLVTKAILEIPSKQGADITDLSGYFARLKELLHHFLPLFKNYVKNSESQLDVLNCLKDYSGCHSHFLPLLMKVLHFMYENDVLEEDVIVDWFEELSVKDDMDKLLHEKLSPFVKWLQEAEEESE